MYICVYVCKSIDKYVIDTSCHMFGTLIAWLVPSLISYGSHTGAFVGFVGSIKSNGHI